jgi:hypothetical protein
MSDPSAVPFTPFPALLMTKNDGDLPVTVLGPLLKPRGQPTGLVLIRFAFEAPDRITDPADLRLPVPDAPHDPTDTDS